MSLGSLLKGAGHILAKPLGVAARVGGAAGGMILGGPGGAAAGYKLGDSLGNIEEDALKGRNTASSIKRNAAGAITGGLGVYGMSKTPNTGGIMNFGRRGPAGAGGIPAYPGHGMPEPDLSAVPGAVNSIGNKNSAELARLGLGGGGAAALLAGRIGGGAGAAASANGGGTPGTGSAAGAPAPSSDPWWKGLLKTPGVAEGLIGLGGSALQGYGQGKIAEADRQWEKDKYGMDNAGGIQKQIESAPLRDRAQFMLSQRMGLPQQSFSPKDIFNPGGAGTMGGYDQTALNAANAGYKPGAGGVDPSVLQAILKKMGYGNTPQPAAQTVR